MKYIVIFVFMILSQGLAAQSGLSQSHLLSVTPDMNNTVVAPDTSFSYTFDLPLYNDEDAIKSIAIKHESIPIEILTNIKGSTLTLSPTALLEKGNYTVSIPALILVKEDTGTFKPKNFKQKIAYSLCSLFYKDVWQCPLCKLSCLSDTTVQTESISYTFTVKEEEPKLMYIMSSFDTAIPHSMAQQDTDAFSISAHYTDGTTIDITLKVKYTSSNPDVVQVENGKIISFEEGEAQIEVRFMEESMLFQVSVYESVDGNLLPRNPDNPDATLLGVDKNHNGVRDEVERWIYKEMPTYHHPEIERVIAMQQAKAYQMALEDPTNTNDVVHVASTRGSDCWDHYSRSRDLPFDGAVAKFGNGLRDRSFNTRERLKTYMDYDYTLKGRVFTLTPSYLLDTSYCDQNIDVLP